MAIVGTTIFSHILPVIVGFFSFILIISGSLEEDKAKLALGVTLFIIACVFPYVVLSLIV